MGTEYEYDKTESFVNPYNFISVDENVKRVKMEDFYSEEKLHTGFLECELKAITPLAIIESESKSGETVENKTEETVEIGNHYSYKSYKYKVDGKKELAIPGSSLRGTIRSVYEAATNSCFITLKEDTKLNKRTINTEAFESGILKFDGKKWNLYKAKKVNIIADEDEDGYDECKIKEKKTKVKKAIVAKSKIDTEGHRKLTIGEKEYLSGQYVKFSKDKNIVTSIEKQTDKAEGYIFVGEKFDEKYGEFIFQLVLDKKSKKEERIITSNLDKAIKKLKETIDIYGDEKVNKDEKHSKYTWYEKVMKNAKDTTNKNAFPVWFKVDEKNNNKVILSMASIGRIAFENTINDLVKEHRPCRSDKELPEKDELCKACLLFGTEKGEAFSSRVRFTDAKTDEKEENCIKCKNCTLKELSGPKYSYIPFYMKKYSEFGYDDKDAEIKGRKFYWHNKKAVSSSNEYTADEKTKRNVTVELISPETKFKFKVYYNGITEQQRNELIWSINLWDNNINGKMCNKIGLGKPLGLGSVKMIVSKIVERQINAGGYNIKQFSFDEIKQNPFDCNNENIKELKCMLDFEYLGDTRVTYPYIKATKAQKTKIEENEYAAHQWFQQNNEHIKDSAQLLKPVTEKNQTMHPYKIK